jgi:hypothetical protein
MERDVEMGEIGPKALKRTLIVMVVAAAALGLQIAAHRVLAQEGAPGWSDPISIAVTEGNLASSVMVMVPDLAGRVHLFFPHHVDESVPDGIDHMSWADGQWTEPVNVLFNPDGSAAHYLRVISDAGGRLHLVWRGGNNRLYYSSAPAEQAGSGHAWLTPYPLGQTLPTQPGIAEAPDGSLWLAYADATQEDTISFTRLAASGEGWISAGRPVSAGTDIYPGHVSLAIDDQGRLHLTWTTFEKPDGWPPAGVFYARSLDQGLTWQKRTVAEGDYGQSGVVLSRPDEVHIFWSSTVGGDGTYHQYSRDGGQRWSPERRFMERGGFSGLPSFAVDSAGDLHYMRGSGVYTMWDGSTLVEPLAITTDEVCLQGQTSCGERAQMTITTGNLLHVVFETDFNQLWHTWKRLDTPPTPSRVAAPAAEGPASGSPLAPAPAATSPVSDGAIGEAADPLVPFDTAPPAASGDQSTVLLLGLLPALLLILGISFIHVRRRKSR